MAGSPVASIPAVFVQDPSLESGAADLLRKHGIHVEAALHRLADAPPAVIVAAVKPQVMDEVMPALAKLAGPKTVLLSIAAGRSIASFEILPSKGRRRSARHAQHAGCHRPRYHRCCRQCRRRRLQQKALCDELLRAVGEVVWVEDEALIDAVTAVSGSGPAYVFLLAECLAEAGRKAGLDAQTAMKLARATVSGAGELLHQSPLDAATLRRNVTSPGGTTAAALNVLMREAGGLQDIMTEAVLAAQKRGQELGK